MELSQLPARLSAMDFIKKCAGPKVDIYVGPKSKHYKLPKDILCHYSKYFDRHFNGKSQEAKEQKLSLPKDDPEWFELLMDWIFSGDNGPFKPKGKSGRKLHSCMEFIRYAEKYDLSAAAFVVTDAVVHILMLDSERNDEMFCLTEYIPLIFRVFPAGHELRTQVAKYCLKLCSTTTHFENEEATVDGFAAEILKQARMFQYDSDEDEYTADPFTGKRHKKT